MTATTIRRNAFNRMQTLLDSAILIRQFKQDDMGDENKVVSADDVLSAGREYGFERVYTRDGCTVFSIHRNWQFTAYESEAAARSNLTPQAFLRYFPQYRVDPYGETL